MTRAPRDVARTLAALRLNPQTHNLVPKVVAGMWGHQALTRWNETTKGFTCLGMTPVEADLGGLMFAAGRPYVAQVAKAGPTWARSQAQGTPVTRQSTVRPFPGDPGAFAGLGGRITAAILTGGVSEAGHAAGGNIDEWLDEVEDRLEDGAKAVGDVLDEAAEESWSVFEKTWTKVVERFSTFDDWKDLLDFQTVMDSLLTVGTFGVHDVVNEGLNALNDKLYELITPWIARLGEAIAEGYAHSRAKIKEGIEVWLDNWDAPKVVIKIVQEVVAGIYDVLLGYPPCVCEQGCIAPIAKALKDNGCPYVKIVGQVLSVIWPICQGRGDFNLNFPEVATCMYMYAGTTDPKEPGLQLLPAANLNKDSLKVVMKIVEQISSSASKNMKFGMPQSYGVYKQYLVDEIARGKQGPTWLGQSSGRSARYYMEHPDEAVAVLEDSNIVNDVIGWVTQYIEWLNTVAAYGKKALDTYDAVKSGNYDLEITQEDLGKLLEQGEAELKKKAEAELQRGVDKVNKKVDDAVADVKNAFKVPGFSGFGGLPSGFAGVSKAEAFMGEWMLAELGLAAREKYNVMVQLYVHELESAGWRTKGGVNYVPSYSSKRQKYRTQCLKELGTPDPCAQFDKKRQAAQYDFCKRNPLLGGGWYSTDLGKCMAAKRKASEREAQADTMACILKSVGNVNRATPADWQRAANDCLGGGRTPRQAWDSGPADWRDTATDYSAWEKLLSKDSKVTAYIQHRRREIAAAHAMAMAQPISAQTMQLGESFRQSLNAVKAMAQGHAPARLKAAFEAGNAAAKLRYSSRMVGRKEVGGKLVHTRTPGQSQPTGEQPGKGAGQGKAPVPGTGTKPGSSRKGMLILGALALGVGVYYATKKR